MLCGSQSSWWTKLTFFLISPSTAAHLDPPAYGSEALFMLMSVCGWCFPVLQTHWLNSTQSSPRLIGIPFLNVRPCVHPAPPPPISIPASWVCTGLALWYLSTQESNFDSSLPQEDDLNGIHIVAFAERSDPGRNPTPVPTLTHLRPKLTSLLCQPPPSLASFPVSCNRKAPSAALVVAC